MELSVERVPFIIPAQDDEVTSRPGRVCPCGYTAAGVFSAEVTSPCVRTSAASDSVFG